MVTCKLQTKRSGPSLWSDLSCESKSASWQLRSGCQLRRSPGCSGLRSSRKRFEIGRVVEHGVWLGLGRMERTFLLNTLSKIPQSPSEYKYKETTPISHGNGDPGDPQQVKDPVCGVKSAAITRNRRDA